MEARACQPDQLEGPGNLHPVWRRSRSRRCKGGEDRYYLPVTHSEGKGTLTCKISGQWPDFTEINLEEMVDDEHFMQMDGQAVFKFAVKKVPEVIREVLEANEIEQEDGLLHSFASQPKNRGSAVKNGWKEPIEKFPMNLREYGNTSSASIPILLDELNRKES